MKNRFDLSGELAASMDRALNSKENKDMFSSSKMFEKLAFSKVSDENVPTELASELAGAMEGEVPAVQETITTTASKCPCGKATCTCKHESDDACECSDAMVMAT